MFPCPAGKVAEAGRAGMVPFALSIPGMARSVPASEPAQQGAAAPAKNCTRSRANAAELCGSRTYL